MLPLSRNCYLCQALVKLLPHHYWTHVALIHSSSYLAQSYPLHRMISCQVLACMPQGHYQAFKALGPTPPFPHLGNPQHYPAQPSDSPVDSQHTIPSPICLKLHLHYWPSVESAISLTMNMTFSSVHVDVQELCSSSTALV